MRILCMPQAFKGCLKAADAAQAMAEGVVRALPTAEVLLLPMADGGDDTLDVLMAAAGKRTFTAEVTGPRGTPVHAQWGVLNDGKTAVIEMAQASGIRLLKPAERDPRVTTTYGTGQLIKAALDEGFRDVLVGVGGSATVDGGAGAVSALGVRFLDGAGKDLPAGGAHLARLAAIDSLGVDSRIKETRIRVACDVNMTLCGPRGAWLFSAQKGATEPVRKELEAALEHYGEAVAQHTGVDIRYMPLAGPAGGLSGGLHAFLGARLEPGAELVLQATGWARHAASADLILTGEGMMDANTFQGKGPGVLGRLGLKAGIPVLAVAGSVSPDAPDLKANGIVEVQTLLSYAASEEESCARAKELIAVATKDVLARWLAGGGK